jgi:hypothetical protein
MNKVELENVIEAWIHSYTAKQMDFQIIEIFKDLNAAKSTYPQLKMVPRVEKCDFSVDFFVLIQKKNGEKDFILINRYAGSVALRSIGEMLVYSSVSDPYASFIISSKGHSSEINNILLNYDISKNLFCYNYDKSIIMFSISKNAEVSKTSILPLFVRENFTG